MIKKYDTLTFKALNELVEFRTSIGIISSVFVGTAYSYYVNKNFRFYLFLAMLIAAIMLDGAATVFNNFFDYKKAKTTEGYLYNVHNPIVARNISPLIAFLIGLVLIGIAGILGIYIVISTHWFLLILGGISILISYLYSGGKYPISYTPWGELISGLFEGTIVIGITFFIQSLSYSIEVLFISIPIALGISNIMLANNICDVDEDRENGRRTLPIVMGQDNAFVLLCISHALMYILNIIYGLLNYLPLGIFFMLLLLPIAIGNIKKFNKTRSKAHGFKFILKNSIIFNLLEGFILLLTAISFL